MFKTANRIVFVLLVVFSFSLNVFGIPKTGHVTEEMRLILTVPTPSEKVNPYTEQVMCVNIGLFAESSISVSGKADVSEDATVELFLTVYKSRCANLPKFDCSQPNTLVVAVNENPSIGPEFNFLGHNTIVTSSPTEPSNSDKPKNNKTVDQTESSHGTDTSNIDTVSTKNGSDAQISLKQTSKRQTQNQDNWDKIAFNTTEGGVYVIQVRAVLRPTHAVPKVNANIILNFELKTPYGYLSALDFPALVFYGVMTGVYAIFAIAWLVVLGLNYTDLVRLQFWVLAVILLGFVEKALLLAEYDTVNQGKELHMLIMLAVVMSALKRSLSRMLLVIVALGYGIVRPRLGDSLTKVIGAGVIYWILATINGVLRARNDTAASNDTGVILSYGLLIICDIIIMSWIFSAIVETRRTLRIRKNLVKLSLYNHFSYALIFSIVAALGFIIWDLFAHIFPSQGCLTDWREVWLHDCFWHVLFVIILGVIMIIWRPGANKKRFAYSLVDDEDNDDDETIEQGTNKNFESVKMRQVGSTSEPPPPSSQAEEDLRWVEENLPTSAIDKALPLILDSDEELMTAKFESSKMD